MMKSNYWNDRNQLYKSSTKNIDKQLTKQYKRAYRKAETEINRLYQEIVDADGKVLHSHLYQYNRLYDTMNNIKGELKALGDTEQLIMSKSLTDVYIANAQIVSKEIYLTTSFTKEQAREAIKTVWCKDGKAWSDRIWNNKSALLQRIEEGIINNATLGKSNKEFITRLKEDFNVGYNEAKRLARTEICAVQTSSTLKVYEEAGIHKYEWMTAKTCACDQCKELDGTTYFVATTQLGNNTPPLHPNCRCCIAPIADDKQSTIKENTNVK